MPTPPDVTRIYRHIDSRKKCYVDELREIVKIPSISSDPTAANHLKKLIKWTTSRLKNLGFNLVLKTPDYKTYKGNKPNVIVGILGKDPKKKTLLYYCHLDVLKVQRAEWKTEPFQLTEKDGKLYGRGTAKMKGPFLCFIHAIECYLELGIELPINIKIICESMYECRSKGLQSILDEVRTTFLPSVDCVLMTESKWLGKDYPCIIYGTRGVCYFNLTIDGPGKDLHSGDFGGVVREPMQDLLFILNNLIDSQGHFNIPHFLDDIVPVTPDEEAFYHKIKMDAKDYRNNVGVIKLGHNEELKLVLMHVWRYPWFNLHFINSSCEGANLLNIPKQVFVRFSVRTVPNQKHEKINKLILNYIKDLAKQSQTPNKVSINAEHFMDPWYEDRLHWNYEAANIATKQVYKEEASFIREGNGFPTLLKLRDSMPSRNILMLPIVNSESKAHSEEENISLQCYIEGTKLLANYFYQLRETARKYDETALIRQHRICRDKL
ncbi:cytosolic non-specific dipeptidase-like [Copidosoma floridanum]|uniref:cytosolic non-specific dipeptidase-like n=1 Tax=Copidosoma floridanum TaxID=29053 RepID=UPI0006C94136|nr:cytosolic non-specific dipeptidase-like [Copidosoma floridanum]